MKTGRNRIVKIAAVVLAVMFLSCNVFAMNFLNNGFTKTEKIEISQKMIENLAVGISSNNLGLKRSSIYFAGFYEIEGLVEPLVEQLSKESNPNTRILIALSLYKIGNDEAVNAIEKLSKNDADPKVKRISYAILNEFQKTQHYSNNLSASK